LIVMTQFISFSLPETTIAPTRLGAQESRALTHDNDPVSHLNEPVPVDRSPEITAKLAARSAPMHETTDAAPAGPSPSLLASDGDLPTVDCDALGRTLLIVLARSEVSTGAHADRQVGAQAHALEHAVRAALSVLQVDVPWAHGRHEQRTQWAQAPDVLTEDDLVRWLLLAGLAAVAQARLQSASLIYLWLRGALQDPSDLHVVWAAALLDAQHPSQAQACLSHLEQPDDLAQALNALALLPAAPQEAVQRLRHVQAQATQPAVHALLDAVLREVQHLAEGIGGTDGTEGADHFNRAAADPLSQFQPPSVSRDD
jgi:hypothetical protein